MHLIYLEISHFRNFAHLRADLNSRFNFLYGANGSGKTSFLEAIYYLGRAKSFRTHLSNRIIQYRCDSFRIHGQLQHADQQISIGIQRDNSGQAQIRLREEAISSIAPISKLMPLQLIHPESHRLLTDGPKLRRHFLDWGMFHVEPSFLSIWQWAQRALKQRNAALRMGQSWAQIQLWDKELIAAAEILDQLRA